MDVDDVGEFVPGCGILNIGIDDFPFEKIWIRADYIRVFNFLEAVRPAIAWHQQPLSPGHPGLVSSLCRFGPLLLTYASARREERMGILCFVLTPCRKEGSHLVSRPDSLSVFKSRRLPSPS